MSERIEFDSSNTKSPRIGIMVVHHIKTCLVKMEANAPTLVADINQLERVQRLETRLVRGLRHMVYEERLRQFNLVLLEHSRLQSDLIMAFKIFKSEVSQPKSFLQHLCNFCPHSLTIFSKLLPQTIYVFPYPPIPEQQMWLLLALVAIPTVNH